MDRRDFFGTAALIGVGAAGFANIVLGETSVDPASLPVKAFLDFSNHQYYVGLLAWQNGYKDCTDYDGYLGEIDAQNYHRMPLVWESGRLRDVTFPEFSENGYIHSAGIYKTFDEDDLLLEIKVSNFPFNFSNGVTLSLTNLFVNLL